ncbi:hypothetical protein L1D41_09845 [Vibrio harveyi]|uniref:hypothetical protein n=1 Tax=Vibrio harveyi TaxID=669 RepID=UPI001EFE5EE7|nr:hypothetical protein [Vibrio harveyi]MCG9609989.1 hypothetical protein [Vibrio harveyi]
MKNAKMLGEFLTELELGNKAIYLSNILINVSEKKIRTKNKHAKKNFGQYSIKIGIFLFLTLLTKYLIKLKKQKQDDSKKMKEKNLININNIESGNEK